MRDGPDGPCGGGVSTGGPGAYTVSRLCDYFVTYASRVTHLGARSADTRQVVRAGLLCLLCALVVLVLAAPAGSTPIRDGAPAAPRHVNRPRPPVLPATAYVAPDDQVFWGGQGGYDASFIDDFWRQSGKHPAIYNYFISWSATDSDMHWLGYRLQDSTTEHARTLLSVSTDGTGLTPGAIAAGAGDQFLLALGRLLTMNGQVTYLRPLSEMNNGDNSYSAYDLAGTSRGPEYTTTQFIRAWRRLALIVRGGDVAAIDAKLRRLRMPPVPTADTALPQPKVSLMWVPLSLGNPEIPRNYPHHFWPGGAYVDWVGTTWYSPYKNAAVMDDLYDNPLWRDKPFAFAEWGIWGGDDPAFVREFFGFLRTHPRVRMAVYYQSAALLPAFALSAHPASRAMLRRAVRWPHLSGYAPELAP